MKRSGKYGYPIDEETRKRISESVRKRWQDKTYREKVENAHKHKLSKEWKNNISKGMTGIKRSDKTKEKNECLSIK